jgi:hypothetical protein
VTLLSTPTALAARASAINQDFRASSTACRLRRRASLASDPAVIMTGRVSAPAGGNA